MARIKVSKSTLGKQILNILLIITIFCSFILSIGAFILAKDLRDHQIKRESIKFELRKKFRQKSRRKPISKFFFV